MNTLIYPGFSRSSSFTVHAVSGNRENDDPLLKVLWEGWLSEEDDLHIYVLK